MVLSSNTHLNSGLLSEWRCQLLLLALFCLFLGLPSSLGSDCSTIPLSLSDLISCDDLSCSLSSHASFALSVEDGSSACLEFISPDETVDKVTVNITILTAHVRSRFLYSYYTDDPWVNVEARCYCPLSANTNCPDCAAPVPRGDAILCIEGHHSNSDCVGSSVGLSGTYCGKVGLTGSHRYKVLKLHPVFSKEFTLKVETGNDTYFLTYTSQALYFELSDVKMNLTVLSDTSEFEPKGEFIVFDRHSMNDFYFLDSEDVNGLDEFDPRKIGWFKTSHTKKVDDSISNRIKSVLVDCDSNKINVTFPWIIPAGLLRQRENLLSHRLSPMSSLYDKSFVSELSDSKTVPEHGVQGYQYLSNGILLLGNDGQVTMIGMTTSGYIVPGATIPLAGTYTVQISSSTQMNRTASDWKTYTSIVRGRDGPLNIYLMVDTAGNQFGLCVSNYTYCTNVTFDAVSWPSMQVLRHTFNGTFYVVEPSSTTNISESSLVEEINNGIVNFDLDFRNLTVTFKSSNVNPAIDKAAFDQVLRAINITARSTSIPGDCYFYTEPSNLVVTQAISLGLKADDYSFPIDVTSYKGICLLGIRCHKKLVNKYLDVDLVNNIDVQHDISNTSDAWYAAAHPGNFFGSIWDGISAFGDAVASFYSGSSFTGSSIFGKILHFVLYAVYIGVIIGVVYLIFLLIRMTFYFVRSKYAKSPATRAYYRNKYYSKKQI